MPIIKLPEQGQRWKHVRTGGDYEIVALGHKAGVGSGPERVVIYRSCETGNHFVRDLEQFCDGRFVRII